MWISKNEVGEMIESGSWEESLRYQLSGVNGVEDMESKDVSWALYEVRAKYLSARPALHF